MGNYRHILLVTNCSKEDEFAFAQELNHFISEQVNVQLSLVHIIPKIPPYYLQCPASLALERQLKDKAQTCLKRFQEHLGIHNIPFYIRAGSLQTEVFMLAEQLKADLVLMAKEPEENLMASLLRKWLHLPSKPLRRKIYIQALLDTRYSH